MYCLFVQKHTHNIAAQRMGRKLSQPNSIFVIFCAPVYLLFQQFLFEHNFLRFFWFLCVCVCGLSVCPLFSGCPLCIAPELFLCGRLQLETNGWYLYCANKQELYSLCVCECVYKFSNSPNSAFPALIFSHSIHAWLRLFFSYVRWLIHSHSSHLSFNIDFICFLAAPPLGLFVCRSFSFVVIGLLLYATFWFPMHGSIVLRCFSFFSRSPFFSMSSESNMANRRCINKEHTQIRTK